MRQTPLTNPPSQRRAEIVQILPGCPPTNLRPIRRNLGNGEEFEESSLTSLDVSPELRLHVCNDNTL